MEGENGTEVGTKSDISNPVLDLWRSASGQGTTHWTQQVPLENPLPVKKSEPLLSGPSGSELADTRVRRVNLEAHLESENVRLNELFAEGEAVKSDILHYSNVVHKLKTRCSEADAIWRNSLKEYVDSQKKYAEVHDALTETALKWKHESSELFRFRERLKALQQKRPQLEAALMTISNECDVLSQKVAAATVERDKLEVLLKNLTDTNREARSLVNRKSVSTQTTCNLQFISEMDKIKGDLTKQMNTVQRVREAIDLVRRCS